jgi:hypothetical protein
MRLVFEEDAAVILTDSSGSATATAEVEDGDCVGSRPVLSKDGLARKADCQTVASIKIKVKHVQGQAYVVSEDWVQ